MNFEISQEIDVEAQKKSVIINELSKSIKDFLQSRDYGEGLQNLFIGCICVKTREGYENWFKIRKPKYKQIERINLLNNSILELKAVFSYDIKLDFDAFVLSKDVESRKILVIEILRSLSNLDALPKRLKNFDKHAFKNDLELLLSKEITI